MRISRPCYDKYHRCPGRVGGGMQYAKRVRCTNGYVEIDHEDRWWKWKMHRCTSCDVVVLPYMIRWVDPSWIRNWIGWQIWRLKGYH